MAAPTPPPEALEMSVIGLQLLVALRRNHHIVGIRLAVRAAYEVLVAASCQPRLVPPRALELPRAATACTPPASSASMGLLPLQQLAHETHLTC